MPLSVLGFYGAILIWAVLIARGFSSPRRWPAIAVFGLLLLLFLNIRYLIEGAPSGIAFFVSLYDFFDNLGLSRGDAPLAMTTCANNACSLWGSTFELHQTWGVAFFDRFVEAPSLRTNTLYLHLACNSIVFVLMHIQLFKPGHTASGVNHAWLGRLTMMFPDDRYGWLRFISQVSTMLSRLMEVFGQRGGSIPCHCACTGRLSWGRARLFEGTGSDIVSG
jgi:hypothetical protein